MSLLLSPMILGLAEARHVVLPDGIVASGYPSVKATCARLKLGHDPWQAGVSQCIFAKGADGDYAADTVGLSVTRQVGKTYLVGTDVFADSIITPGTTTVWTAHRFKVARETFDVLRSVALMPSLAPHIDPNDIHTAAGNESIRFRNGSRIVFAARERGSVRGIAKVRRLILDEAQILTHAAMSDLAPTMNQAENPQIILMGTPPKPTDPSEVFTELRETALSGTSEGLVYIELSAEPDADLDDRVAWKRANPSLGVRTPYKAVERLRKLLSNEDFAREALGIWGDSSGSSVIDPKTWRAIADPQSSAMDPVAYGIDVSPDQSTASIAMAGWRPDGRRHIELVENRKSVDWVVSVAARITQAQHPVCFVVDGGSPAGALIAALRKARVPVEEIGLRAYSQACGTLYNEAMGRVPETEEVVPLLAHLDQPTLNRALAAGRKRKVGVEGAWAWHRVNSEADITPLVAVTLAIHGLSVDMKVKKPSTLYAF